MNLKLLIADDIRKCKGCKRKLTYSNTSSASMGDKMCHTCHNDFVNNRSKLHKKQVK